MTSSAKVSIEYFAFVEDNSINKSYVLANAVGSWKNNFSKKW